MEDHRVLRMMRRPALALALLAGAAGVLTSGSQAATPSRTTVTAPTTPGQTETVTWTDGSIPPGVSGMSSCKGRVDVDATPIRIVVPAGAYDTVDIEYKFTITWTDATGLNDEVLTVVNKDVEDAGGDGQDEGTTDSEVGSSDTSATTEQVVADNLPTGNYEAQ